MAGVEITSDLATLGARLKEVDRVLAAAVRKNVRTAAAQAGQELVSKMRGNAAWSTRIPQATTVRVSFSARAAGVSVKTSKARAPHARPLEMGSRGSGGAYNRHPVFGRNVRVNQPTRPYFFPAVQQMTPEMTALMVGAVEAAIREAGFRGA